MMRVVLYEDVSGLEAVGAVAAARAAGLEVETVSADALVATREGLRLVPTRLGLARLADAEVAVVPGGDPRAALADAGLARALRERRGRWTLASGAGIEVAARAGLCDGRRVARAPSLPPLPGTVGAAARLVADGRLLTCAGGDTLLDLVLHYVGRAHGDDVARKAAESLGREHRPFAQGAEA